jgi:hypothetical protein
MRLEVDTFSFKSFFRPALFDAKGSILPIVDGIDPE